MQQVCWSWQREYDARTTLWERLYDLAQLGIYSAFCIDGDIHRGALEPESAEKTLQRQELCMAIISIAKSHPKSFSKPFTSETKPGFEEAQYALAILCRFGATHETIVAAYRAYPRAIRIPHPKDHLLPLHWACMRELSLETVRFLHQCYPRAASLQDMKRGVRQHTPVFKCCLSKPSTNRLNIVRYLLNACPGSALLRDANGDLPLHVVLGRHVRDPDVVLELLRINPSIASEKSGQVSHLSHRHYYRDKKLPIQLALARPTNGVLWETIIRELLGAYPRPADGWDAVVEAWLKKHSVGVGVEMAAHFFAQRRGMTLDYSRTFPLHAMLDYETDVFRCVKTSTCSNLSQVILDRMGVHLLKTMDDRGRLPLHLALGCPYTWRSENVEFTEHIFSGEPRAGMIRDPSSGLFPFMMVSVTADTERSANEPKVLDIIYRMFRLDAGNFVQLKTNRHDSSFLSPACEESGAVAE